MILAYITLNGIAIAAVLINTLLAISEDERRQAREHARQNALVAVYMELFAPLGQ